MALSAAMYIYGIARSPLPADFGAIGVENEGAPGRVVAIALDDVCVVASEYVGRDKIRPVRKNLDAHNTVIRTVMKTATLVPMAFGHMAQSAAEITKAIKRNRDAIRVELDRLGDKVEMTLRVLWDVENIFEYIVSEDPALRSERDRVFGRSVAPTHSEKFELGRMFEARLLSAREEHTERVINAFEGIVTEVKESPPKHEKMVMNLAFLVARDLQKAFEEKVYQVAGNFPAEYTFDFNGPWAPFNFVELDFKLASAKAA